MGFRIAPCAEGGVTADDHQRGVPGDGDWGRPLVEVGG